MILFPPAKVNLGLNVLYKRNDGYHEIDTCMVPVPLCDILEIVPSETFQFVQSGLAVDSNEEHNLCVKAFRLLKKTVDFPNVYIHLRKQIPMGAGLGGGSSDAAYVLKGINELFKLNLTLETLEILAAQLGSDCPFFIQNIPQIAQGRGEILKPIALNLNGYFIKLINPGIHSNTAKAYQEMVFSDQKSHIKDVLEGAVSNWKNTLTNDFEKSLFEQHPILLNIKNSLYLEGACYASMSGSGSTMYGLFKNLPSYTFQKEKNFFEYICSL
jgi:4-diphosphocytidyl-2-C-methyl-D-erythritol kinase